MLCKGHTSVMPSSFKNDYPVENLQFVVAKVGEKRQMGFKCHFEFCLSYFKDCVNLGKSSSWILKEAFGK